MLTPKRVSTVVLSIFIIILWNKIFASEIPLYELNVKVIPEIHTLVGRAKISVPEGRKVYLRTGGLSIKTFSINGQQYEVFKDSLQKINAGTGEKIIEIDYNVVLTPADIRENVENETGYNSIDTAGIMLLSNWYPELRGLCMYRLTAEIPAGIEAISESDATIISHHGNYKIIKYYFPHPISGITLVAGRYYIHKEEFNGITIKTYLSSEDTELAQDYIDHTKLYIELYESLLGKFPYKTFSIVENKYQTGYSFPTYTLLGSQVIRLPFIVKTSLGHEILHQWFGNYVYVNYEKGNWSEGLTTYLSDHWYEHLKGKGADYRKKIMIDYMNYVSPESEISLQNFVNRTDLSSRSIGYGKAAMVFHMLRKRLGDDAFFKGLLDFITSFKYKNASWDDIRASFVSSSGEDLEQFFDQWVKRKGVPSIKIENAQVVFRDGQYLLKLDIIQDGNVYPLDLNERVETDEGEYEFVIHVDREKVHYERAFSGRPLKLFLDENHDIMRRLTEEERPPVISAFTGNKEGIVVAPEQERDLYSNALDFFSKQGYKLKNEKDITNDDIKKNSLLIMSTNSRIYKRLFAGQPLPEGGFVVKVNRNPLNSDRVVVVFQAKDQNELNLAIRKIDRYGNYSLLVFEEGKNIAKETSESEKGMVKDFSIKVDVVETKSTLHLDEIIEKIKDKRIIYVGEAHTEYSHHLTQYEIISKLYEKNSTLIIGMEMFQRPFQKYLDQYIQRELSEEDFLKKTEYFTRWAFDYNLYRDILHFARTNSIPVIALNLQKELIEKVSKEGIDSLTEEEYSEIPHDIDLTNQEYRTHLREVFSQHKNNEQKDFENFFQSQLLWDETMAHTIAGALEKYQDSQMVVLAGNGHIRYSWGIPDRVRRLTGESFAIILNDGGEGIDRRLADFVLFASHIETPESPRLMVFLKEGEGDVVVEKVIKEGPADKAGIQKGDIIKKFDGKAIEDVSDIKIILLNKKKGDAVTVSVQRKKFIFGTKEIVFDMLLE